MPYIIFPIKIRHLKFASIVTFKVCFLSKSLLKSPSLIDKKGDDHFCYSFCFLFYFRVLYVHNLTCNVLTPLDWVKLSVSCIIFCYPWFPCKEIEKYSMSLATFHPYKHIHQWPSCRDDLRRVFAQKQLQPPPPQFNFFAHPTPLMDKLVCYFLSNNGFQLKLQVTKRSISRYFQTVIKLSTCYKNYYNTYFRGR